MLELSLRPQHLLAVVSTCALLAALGQPSLFAKDKKKQEPKTQVLPLPRELPNAVSAATSALQFRMTPLLKTGRLSAQIHESVARLIRDTKGERVVSIRAFVAGAGDSRRVQTTISEMFSEKHLPLPVLSIVQVGVLAEETAQVVLEAVVETQADASSQGLAVLTAKSDSGVGGAVSGLVDRLRKASVEAIDVQHCTCYVPNLVNTTNALAEAKAQLPNAVIDLVQPQRQPGSEATMCEAIARVRKAGDAKSSVAASSGIVFIMSPQVVVTGMQLSFGEYLDDAKAALERLVRTAGSQHAELKNLVILRAYSLTERAASALEKNAPAFSVNNSAITVQMVEGLPSADASLGMEALFAAPTSEN